MFKLAIGLAALLPALLGKVPADIYEEYDSYEEYAPFKEYAPPKEYNVKAHLTVSKLNKKLSAVRGFLHHDDDQYDVPKAHLRNRPKPYHGAPSPKSSVVFKPYYVGPPKPAPKPAPTQAPYNVPDKKPVAKYAPTKAPEIFKPYYVGPPKPAPNPSKCDIPVTTTKKAAPTKVASVTSKCDLSTTKKAATTKVATVTSKCNIPVTTTKKAATTKVATSPSKCNIPVATTKKAAPTKVATVTSKRNIPVATAAKGLSGVVFRPYCSMRSEIQKAKKNRKRAIKKAIKKHRSAVEDINNYYRSIINAIRANDYDGSQIKEVKLEFQNALKSEHARYKNRIRKTRKEASKLIKFAKKHCVKQPDLSAYGKGQIQGQQQMDYGWPRY